MKLILAISIIALLISCSKNEEEILNIAVSESVEITDSARNRIIPAEIYSSHSKRNLKNELVIINAGYGCSNTEYSYLAKTLAKSGFLVVAIQHELESDSMLPSGDNMYELRLPNWNQGVKNIQSALYYIHRVYPKIKLDKINLIGHSNGGDISMLFAKENPEIINACISLDHRRMPIPRTDKFKILTFRADEFTADDGVIPNDTELEQYGIEVIYLKNVGHNYLRDNARLEIKEFISKRIGNLLQ